MRFARYLFATLLVLWLVATAAGAAFYRVLLYPAPIYKAPSAAAVATRTFVASDGVAVRALFFPGRETAAPQPQRTVVCFHGNGEIADNNVWLAEALNARGLAVVLVEYRGYGASAAAGKPTEAGLYADAAAVLDGLALPPERVVLFGQSLGTGVATEMAARGRGGKLVLLAPYTSIPAVAARWVPILPVGLFVQDRYDNLKKAPQLSLPTLIAHGDDDRVVPYDMGVTLAQTIRDARLLTLRGFHHNNLFAAPGLLDAIAAFCSA